MNNKIVESLEQSASLLHPEIQCHKIDLEKNQNSTIFQEPTETKLEEAKQLKNETTAGWRRFQGFLFSMLHVLAFSTSTLIAKFLTHYHPFTLTSYRFQGVLLPSILVLFVSYSHENSKPEDDKKGILDLIWPPHKNENWKRILFLLGRVITGCSAITLLMYSLQYIQVGDTLVIQAAGPIFTNLLAYLVLNEPSGIFEVCLALLSILGVAIISRPPLLTGAEEFDSNVLIGCIFSFAAMLLSVTSLVCLRYLKNVHFSLISFSLGAWGTLQNLCLAFIFGVFQLPIDLKDTVLIMSCATCVFIAQMALTFAVKKEEAGPVMLYKTSNCVFGFILQKIFLDIPADIYSILGASLVIVGVVATMGRNELMALPEGHKVKKMFSFALK